MNTFWLYRWKDGSGISGTGIVAEGVIFEGGQVAMRWNKSGSMGIYSSIDQVKEIHGHGGDTEVVELSHWFLRGAEHCALDQMEGAPFASVGGKDQRQAMRCPEFVHGLAAEAEYLRGYRHQARVMYGGDWQTCAFGWTPALEINVVQERG